MNKLVAIIIGAVVVVGGGAYLLTRSSDTTTNTSTKASDTSKTTYGAVDACDVLTEAVASQVLGATPTKGDTAAGNTATDSVSVSNCTYYLRANTTGSALEQAQGTQTASLLVRSAKDSTGAAGNQAQFATLPSGSQWVAGYGAKAYWNPQFGQLNILDNNNWYILSHYAGTTPTSATLDQAKVLADAMEGNLK